MNKPVNKRPSFIRQIFRRRRKKFKRRQKIKRRLVWAFTGIIGLSGCYVHNPVRFRRPAPPGQGSEFIPEFYKGSVDELSVNSRRSLHLNKHYLWVGNPKKQTLLCLPGVYGQAYHFHRLIPHAIKDYNILIVEPPGKGYSLLDQTYQPSSKYYDDFWLGVIEDFQLENFVAVGHSSGVLEFYGCLMRHGPAKVPVSAVINLAGWNPAILKEPIPLVGGNKGNYLLTLRFVGPSFCGWYGMFSNIGLFDSWIVHEPFPGKEMTSEELKRIYLEFFRPFRDDAFLGLFPNNNITFGYHYTLKAERSVILDYEGYHDRYKPYLNNILGVPCLSIGSSHDPWIHGPQDVHQVTRILADGSSLELGYVDQNGFTQSERFNNALIRIHQTTSEDRRFQVKIIPKSGHRALLTHSKQVFGHMKNFLKDPEINPGLIP